LFFLRTDAAADGRQPVFFFQHGCGSGRIAFDEGLDECGDVDLDRTAGAAGRGFALEAALCFRPRLFRRVAQTDLFEVFDAFR
jgi:hypothetical protein